jgi:DNA-binding Xre family transcriptional regulator
MTGRSLTTSIEGIEKAKKALRSNSLNQTALARELGLSRSTVTNFFRQIPIERLNFEEICTKLGLNWQDIVDITANETEIEEIENTIDRS